MRLLRVNMSNLETSFEDLPEDYISIVSGLGEANPNALLVVPLKMEDKVFGVIEIASFNKFEKYQIEFAEKIGENIAATIASAKANEQTIKLLEQTKENADQGTFKSNQFLGW